MDMNDDLRAQLFSYGENQEIYDAKMNIEGLLPDWIKTDPNIVVAGGCFASRIQGEIIKDIDVFILGDRNHPAIEKQKQSSIKRKMVRYYPDINDKTQDYVRNNAAVSEVWTEPKSKIQFIYTHHETRQDLIKDFDYAHCMTSYYIGKLYITRKIYEAIKDRKLVVNNDKNIQEWRRNKFLNRGYKDAAKFAPEPTLGDILAGALKKVQTSYVSYENGDDEFSWVR